MPLSFYKRWNILLFIYIKNSKVHLYLVLYFKIFNLECNVRGYIYFNLIDYLIRHVSKFRKSCHKKLSRIKPLLRSHNDKHKRTSFSYQAVLFVFSYIVLKCAPSFFCNFIFRKIFPLSCEVIYDNLTQ